MELLGSEISLRRCIRASIYRLIGSIAFFSASALQAETNSMLSAAISSITDEELYHHVEVLADDVYEGRAAGSRGGHAAATYLVDRLKATDAEPAGNDGGYAQTFSNDCRNILARLSGIDPQLDGDVIVVGAHYDHVGYGTRRRNARWRGPIHNGADDNASGTSVLLELIQAFKLTGIKTRRSILFAFWDSEETGLVGSRYWIGHPTVPLERVKLNITIDMVGRLRDERLFVLGTRSGFGLRRLFSDETGNAPSLDFSWDVSGNSDHWPFLERGIPIALIHTGLHADYHRPGDDAEKINRAGMREVGQYLFTTLVKSANEDRLPAFRDAVKQETDRHRRELERPLPTASLANWPTNEPRPRLGISWREDDAEPGAVLITRVVAGSPAAAADFALGDRVLEIDGQGFANGAELRAKINALCDAARPEFDVLIERRGQLRTITVKTAPPGK